MLKLLLWKTRCWWLYVRHGVVTVGTPNFKTSKKSEVLSPSVDVVRHHRTKRVFVIEHAPYARIPGTRTPYGEPIEISIEQLEDALLPTILSALDAFETRQPVSGDVIGPESEKLHRSRSYAWVTIGRENPATLRIDSIYKKQGGSGQGVGESVKITLPCSGRDFQNIVEQAWRISGISPT